MNSAAAPALMSVAAEICVPTAKAQLVQFNIPGPSDNVLRANDTCWLDLCLTPRAPNARASYVNHWSPQHFERIGKVFMVPAGEAIHARSDGDSLQTSLLCHLRPEQLRHWFDDDLRWTPPQLHASLDIADVNIRALLLRLADELRAPGFASDALVELVIAQLAIDLRRYCLSITDAPRSGGLAAWRLRLINERLEVTDAAPTLSELADLCKLSVRQLTRGFRSSRGRSLGDYIADSQLDHAKQLLASDQSVKAIAYTLGFASPSSFCFAFRRATGQTARQFRHGAPKSIQ